MIVSAMMSATILLLFDFFCLFVASFLLFDSGNNSELLIYIIAGFLGLIGFYGFTLLASNKLIKKKFRTIISLFSGLMACVMIIDSFEIELDDILFQSFSSFNDFMISYFVLWPNFVALYFIIFLSIKLIIEKASN